MKKPKFKIGDLVGFKGRGLGFGRVVSMNLRDKHEPLYHIELLAGDTLVASHGKCIEKLSPEDLELVQSLHSIGNL